MRPGREARAPSSASGRFVVRMKKTYPCRGAGVHLVEQLVQQNFLADRFHAGPIARDQVGVLDDHDARLKQSRERHVLAEQSHVLGQNEKRRMPLHGAGQLVDRVRLARAGRAVEQHALLR
jgi:hypothetical protein